MGLDGEKRRDIKSTCRHFTNREAYRYFKYCSIVKSNKLGGVIEKLRPSVEFMGDLAGANSEVSQGEFHQISKKGR